mgnify:FL=1
MVFLGNSRGIDVLNGIIFIFQPCNLHTYLLFLFANTVKALNILLLYHICCVLDYDLKLFGILTSLSNDLLCE